MRIYAIKDEIIGFTGAIMTATNDEQVKRNMAVMVNEPGNQMNLWAKDFSAWYIGEIDKIDGHLTEVQPQLICRGDSLKIPEQRRETENEVQERIQSRKN